MVDALRSNMDAAEYKLVDNAMIAIEKENPLLKGVLPKDYAHPQLDKQRLGQLIDLIGDIGLGDKANRSNGILGRVYKYFLAQFASAESKKGGQCYTSRCVVQVHVETHGGAIRDISIYGQKSNHTTWRRAKINLAIRVIDSNLGGKHADSFHRDLHPDLKADYVLANPPFYDSDWRGDQLKEDKRWRDGYPSCRDRAEGPWGSSGDSKIAEIPGQLNMSRIRSKDATPEMIVLRFVHAAGLRYGLHARDPLGCPYVVFPRLRKAILVYGCFWHRHRCKNEQVVPATRKTFWQAMFEANVTRDRETRRQLCRAGWDVLVVSDCATRTPDIRNQGTVDRISELIGEHRVPAQSAKP